MTRLGVRQDLHGLVDRLPESEMYTARRFLEYLAGRAAEDDEPLSADEEAALAAGLAACRAGDVFPLDEALPPPTPEIGHD